MSNIEKQLNSLRGIKPDKAWKAAQKEILMNEISTPVRDNKVKAGFLFYTKELLLHDISFLSQPIASAAFIFMLIFGGGFFSITAASEATPGSFLYTVKIVGEKTQFAFAANQENKVKLQVKFAERRAEEIASLAGGNDHEVIGKIADSLREEIESVQSRLIKIEEDKPGSAVAMAKDIENTTSLLRSKLKNTKNALTSNTASAMSSIDQAIRSVDAAGLSALNTIVNSADENSEDLSSRVASKLKITKEKIGEVKHDADKVFSAGLGRSEQGIEVHEASVEEKTKEAAEKISEAEELLEGNNYKEALVKINESENLLNQAVEAVDESKIEEETSSTTPKVEGEVKGIMEAGDGEVDEKATSTLK